MIADWANFNQAVCSALGVDASRTVSLTIKLVPRGPAMIELTQFVTDVDNLASVLKNYELKAIDDEAAPGGT